jgi:hypothetical protein
MVLLNFKVFQVYENVNYKEREHLFFEHLRDTDFFVGDHGLRYVINNDLELEDSIIVGTISQEYIPNSYEVNEDKSLEIMDDVEPFERTFFAYDFQTRAFLVQNRRYSPENLNPGKTLTRLVEIFDDGYRQVFNSSFSVIPVLLPEDNSLFVNIFRTHKVVELVVSGINDGRLLADDIVLSDDVTLNRQMREIWNNDASLTDLVHLRTTLEGDLNESVIAKAALYAPGGVVELIKYYDPEEDGLVTKKRSTLNQISIPDINNNTESITAFRVILDNIREKRSVLRRMRQIRE